ncbi:hypothetical protein [environmental halophage 1 AAJ-2005]|nr:hypothetical protein [environmental halophage 1 AAJ-2005]
MTQEAQLDNSDPLFTGESDVETAEWSIELSASRPVELDEVQSALADENWASELEKKGIIPKNVTLDTVTLSQTGTYYDAYAKAIDTCEYLNEEADIPNSHWEFLDKDIHQTGPE